MAREERYGGSLLVHCDVNTHTAATIVAAYIAKYRPTDVEEIIGEIEAICQEKPPVYLSTIKEVVTRFKNYISNTETARLLQAQSLYQNTFEAGGLEPPNPSELNLISLAPANASIS